MKLLSKITLFFLFFCLNAVLSSQNSSSYLTVNKVKQKLGSLNEALYYVENNAVKNLDELKYESTNKFEADFLTAVIDYKQTDFENSYELLKSYLDTAPRNFNYYEYLAKVAHILGKDSELKEFTSNKSEKGGYNYLAGIINFLNTNYNSAAEKFNKALHTEKDSVRIFIYLSNAYRKLGDYEKANQILEKAQSLTEKTSPVYSEILVAKGSLFFLSGEYEKAKEIYEAGLNLAAKSFNNVESIKAILNLGMISDLYGNSIAAQDNFAKAYNLSKSIDQKELEAIVLSEWGVSYTYVMQPVEARNKYEESYTIFKRFNNNERMALTVINIANQYSNISNYQSALKKYNLALDLAGENLRTKMLAFRGLGDVYTNLSNYASALEFYNKAKEVSKQLKDIGAETEINLGIGTLFYNLRKYNDALEIIMETYGSINETEQPYLKAELNQKTGIIYLSLSEYKKAEEFLLSAVKLSDEHGDIYSSILSNTYLAYTYIAADRINSGKNILLKQIELCNEYELHQLLGVQYLILSEISNGKNKLLYLDKAKENSLLANDENNLISVFKALGEYYATGGQFEKAEEQFINAIAIIERTHTVLGSNGQIQIDYFSDKAEVYNSLAELYLETGESKKAFAVIDKSRSRNTMYNLSAIRIASSQNEQLINQFYDLHWKIYNDLIDKQNRDSVKLELTKLVGELGVENELNISVESIKTGIENYLNNTMLAVDETFIKYFISSENVYAFLINKNKFNLVKLPSNIKEITKNISLVSPYYNDAINNNEISFNKDLFAFKAEKSYELFVILLEPLIKGIPKNSNIIFSLPNKLLNLPFEFLCTTTGEDDKGNKITPKYLVEDYSISYVPSLAILRKLKTKPHFDNNFALIAGEPNLGITNDVSESRGVTKLDLYARDINLHSLKYSLDEVETIEKYFKNNLLLIKDEATETNFISNVQKASVIHLSTHSFLFQNNPVVLLSGDEKNDGYLEIGEIAKLKLNSDLVVLSSCKSGLGRFEENEGIIGMQKVFFDVGASSVILSLWDVSDEHTAELMKYFYDFLSEGYDNSSALKKAKVKFIKEVDPNPYYWAAFTLAGNIDKVKIEKESTSNYFIYLFVFMITIIIYYLIKKKTFYTVKAG